ncbi:MAG: hypothetical protein JXQ75_22300 [Phycisphaerae bacterium]|nr:hypothetical protein [Phycisphaerae bacterium]
MKKWNLASLRDHQRGCLFLGDGAVAVTYVLCGDDRVRAKFFLYEKGSFKEVATDTGDAGVLIQILNMYEDTEAIVRRHGRAAAERGDRARTLPSPPPPGIAGRRPSGASGVFLTHTGPRQDYHHAHGRDCFFRPVGRIGRLDLPS